MMKRTRESSLPVSSLIFLSPTCSFDQAAAARISPPLSRAIGPGRSPHSAPRRPLTQRSMQYLSNNRIVRQATKRSG